jgi:UPF0176 protein
VSEIDKASVHYVQGVSCPQCFDKVSEHQRRRFEEREKQVGLAREKGLQHIGSDAKVDNQEQRALKYRYKEQQCEALVAQKRLA